MNQKSLNRGCTDHFSNIFLVRLWTLTHEFDLLTWPRYDQGEPASKKNPGQRSISSNWLTELRFYIPLDIKQVILETFHKPISWLYMEKLNLKQQQHTFTTQKNVQHKINTKKTKARFSRLLWHLAWKRRRPILVLALHKSVTYLLIRHLSTYLQPRDPHGTISSKVIVQTLTETPDQMLYLDH